MKIAIKTKGFINLISRNKVETNKKGTPKIYRSRKRLLDAKELLLKAKIVQEYRSRIKSEFSKALVKAGILESAVSMAKGIIKASKVAILTSIERFEMNVQLWKAYKNLNSFKRGLSFNFKSLLF